MKKHFIFLSLLLSVNLLTGCENFNDEFQDESAGEELTAQTLISFENAVYHEATGSWICPGRDPYALENFQKAYSDILMGRGYVNEDAAGVRDELSKIQLQATHYNIKIYPKTEEELRDIEHMEDVNVSYIPFDYVELPESEIKKSQLSEEHPIFPNEGKYVEVYDDFSTVEGPQEPRSFIIPAIYAVWPCIKPFPSGMDYEMLYEVFLPRDKTGEIKAALSSAAFEALERAAISSAGDGPYTIKNAGFTNSSARGRVFSYDEELKNYVPLVNLKVRYKLGSQVWETYTGDDGLFFIGTVIPAEAILSFVFETPQWRLTLNTNSSPYSITYGTHVDNHDRSFYTHVSFPIHEVHRAVNYYHNNYHSVPIWTYPKGITVNVYNYRIPEAGGYFHFSQNKNAYVSIYNEPGTGYLIGATLHEFGHWTQYCEKGSNYNTFKNTDRLIKESWASYVGWHLGESYYYSLGWIKNDPSENITQQSRQTWDPVNSSYYSPMFVDLRDDYDQGLPVVDRIKGVSYATINKVGKEASDWQSARNLISRHISDDGFYIRHLDLMVYFLPYDNFINPGSVRLSPNPTTGPMDVKIGGEVYGTGTVNIFNTSGRGVYNTTFTNLEPGKTYSVNVASLSAGTYTLRMNYTGNDSFSPGTATASFIKQ